MDTRSTEEGLMSAKSLERNRRWNGSLAARVGDTDRGLAGLKGDPASRSKSDFEIELRRPYM